MKSFQPLSDEADSFTVAYNDEYWFHCSLNERGMINIETYNLIIIKTKELVGVLCSRRLREFFIIQFSATNQLNYGSLADRSRVILTGAKSSIIPARPTHQHIERRDQSGMALTKFRINSAELPKIGDNWQQLIINYTTSHLRRSWSTRQDRQQCKSNRENSF